MGEIGIADAHDAATFSAKQRLHDNIAAELVKGGQRIVLVFTDDCFWDGQPGLMQLGRGEVFVHGAFECLGRVDDLRACGFQSSQHIHAIDDLFERTGGHRADEQDVMRRRAGPLVRSRCRADQGGRTTAPDAGHQPLEVQPLASVASRAGRSFQVAVVPAPFAGEDADVHEES